MTPMLPVESFHPSTETGKCGELEPKRFEWKPCGIILKQKLPAGGKIDWERFRGMKGFWGWRPIVTTQ
jgi:hypothetical protein